MSTLGRHCRMGQRENGTGSFFSRTCPNGQRHRRFTLLQVAIFAFFANVGLLPRPSRKLGSGRGIASGRSGAGGGVTWHFLGHAPLLRESQQTELYPRIDLD